MNIKFPLFIIIIFIYFSLVQILGATTYFFDSQNGNDSNIGVLPDSAWESLRKINSIFFQTGDTILLKCNSVWSGTFWPKGSGTEETPIVMDKYGAGEKPLINGGGNSYTLYLYNQEYWEIKNLEITNFNSTDSTSYKRGVHIKAGNYGKVRHIYLENLEVHDINGSITPGNSSKHNGGIFFEAAGSITPTFFENILIEGCHIYDVDRTGISLNSSWSTRTIDTNTNWTPSINVVIRNNVIERTGGNGLIWRVSHKPLVEYNIFHKCATKLSGNAMFFFNCDSALAQFNEAYLTVYNPGDTDAGAFDADYRCKNTIYQYNYSHDNGEAAFIAPSNGTSPTAFQIGAIFRYNISQNDRREVFHVSGPITNTTFYNNTVYLGAHLSDITIIYHKSWGGYPDNTSYYNNVIYNEASLTQYNLGNSTDNKFHYNVFYGNHPSSEPYDPHKLTTNPQFIDPGSGQVGIETVSGFKLKQDSPCIDSGMHIENNGGRDYWGNIVPFNLAVDRGAFEYPAISAISDPIRQENRSANFFLYSNYPNPFNSSTNISFELFNDGYVYISIYSIEGKEIFTLSNNFLKKGQYTFSWNGSMYNSNLVSSGIYFCKMEMQNISKSIKMVVLK